MTQEKKVIAVLLAVMFVLSALSMSFCASAEVQTCTITVELEGDGLISDGTVSSSSGFTVEYEIGQTVTLVSTPASGKETVFWVNAATERVVSFNDRYSFSAGSDLYLYVVVEDEQTLAAQNGVHQVIYLTEGNNILYSETLPLGNTTYFENNIASLNMFANGKTWEGWDKTPEEVAATNGRVFVHPTYQNTVQSYIVTTIIGDTVSQRQWQYGKSLTVTAPETLEGEPFSYWEVPGDEDDPNSRDMTASYSREYPFIVVMPVTLRAVYGEEVGSGGVTRVVGDVPEMANNAITFYTEWSVTEDYTVVQGGLLATRDSGVGNLESAFVLNTGDDRIKAAASKETSRNVAYGARIRNWTAVENEATGVYYYPLIYVRSFLIIRDNEGVVTTLYSPIYTADYVNVSFVDPIEDNPHDDIEFP
jgi:hypothetical protein